MFILELFLLKGSTPFSILPTESLLILRDLTQIPCPLWTEGVLVSSRHKVVETPLAVGLFLFDNVYHLLSWSVVCLTLYTHTHNHTHPLVCIPLGWRTISFHFVHWVPRRTRLAVALSYVNFQIRSKYIDIYMFIKSDIHIRFWLILETQRHIFTRNVK